MKKFKSIEWMEVYQSLPSPKKAFEERRLTISVNFFPKHKRHSAIIRTEYETGGDMASKKVLAEVEIISFKLNMDFAIPFWEPTEDIIILSDKS